MNKHSPFPPNNNKFSLGQGAVIVLLLFILLGNVFYLGYRYYGVTILTNSNEENSIQKLALIHKILEDNYLYADDVPYEQIFDGAVEGMAGSLGDPYTRYISEREYEEFRIQTEGNFGGIGVSVDVNNDTSEGVIISTINEGEGADLAGLKPNDRIVEVDGEPIEGMNIEDAIALIRGEIGTDVHLKVIREGEKEPLSIIIQRGKVELENIIEDVLEDDIGYIRISRFSRDSYTKFKNSLNNLEKDGIESLIIDLRGNPGGLFDEVNKIASLLTGPNKELVTVNSKNYTYPINTVNVDRKIDLDVIVLVDQMSASASEILAGALKTHNKATIIGENTFGKGLIQETLRVDEDSALIITVSEYITPDGEKINGKGIKPDIEVVNKPDKLLKGIDSQLNKSIEFLKGEGGNDN